MNLQVYDRQELVYAEVFPGPVELGRQREKGEPLFSPRQDRSGPWRVAVASIGEDTISRRHVRLDPLSDGRVRLSNLSEKMPIGLTDGRELAPTAWCELTLPAVLAIDRWTVRVQRDDSERRQLQGLSE